MPRIAICSDTHVPSRRAALPGFVREELQAADHVIHAGDVDSTEALASIQQLAPELTVVAGNMDPPIDLPRVASVTLGGVTFVVTHGHQRSGTWHDGLAAAVREQVDDVDTAVGVAGHSHEVVDEVYDGVRLLNPGSATGAPPASRPTMYRATAADGTLDVQLVEG